MTSESVSYRHPGFWNCRLTAILCIQIGLLLTICCSGGTPGKGIDANNEIAGMQQKLAEMNGREKALQEEYSLARNSQPYLIVHSSNRTIELKARGRVFRTFEVREISKWETAINGDVIWTVTEMKPIQRSDRPKIKPGAGEEATAEAAKQNPWGLHRMPRDYDLVCSDGNILEIRGLPSGRSGFGVTKSVRALYRRSVDRYRRWRAIRNPELEHTIRLWIDENDSRQLFWSLPKEIKILVFSRSAPPSRSSQNNGNEQPSMIVPFADSPLRTKMMELSMSKLL